MTPEIIDRVLERTKVCIESAFVGADGRPIPSYCESVVVAPLPGDAPGKMRLEVVIDLDKVDIHQSLAAPLPTAV